MADHANDPTNLGPFLLQLSEVGSEEAFELERQILSLREHPGWKLVQGMIASAVDNSMKRLKFAPIKDHPTMARDIGFAAGLESQTAAAESVMVQAARWRKELADLDREETKR